MVVIYSTTSKCSLASILAIPVQMIKYHFNLVTVVCMVWEEESNAWLSDKCDVSMPTFEYN